MPSPVAAEALASARSRFAGPRSEARPSAMMRRRHDGAVYSARAGPYDHTAHDVGATITASATCGATTPPPPVPSRARLPDPPGETMVPVPALRNLRGALRAAVLAPLLALALAACAVPAGGPGGAQAPRGEPVRVALLVPGAAGQPGDAAISRDLERAARLAAADLQGAAGRSARLPHGRAPRRGRRRRQAGRRGGRGRHRRAALRRGRQRRGARRRARGRGRADLLQQPRDRRRQRLRAGLDLREHRRAAAELRREPGARRRAGGGGRQPRGRGRPGRRPARRRIHPRAHRRRRALRVLPGRRGRGRARHRRGRARRRRRHGAADLGHRGRAAAPGRASWRASGSRPPRSSMSG